MQYKHTFQWICSIANPPPDLTKPHCDPANQRRPVRGTQPSSRTLDNPHLGLSGQTILVQHLTNYRLTGQSILYQLQTGWLVSIMILIVPIADWLAVIYYNIDCNHCRPDGWNVLSRLQTEWPAVIVTIANWMADIYCTHCRLDGHSLWGDPKLGLWVWIWMVYISSGVNFLGDSESEDLLYPLQIGWPFIMRWY